MVATLKRHALVDGNFSAEITQKIASQEDHNVPWWVVLARHNLAQVEPADLPEWKVIEEEELPRTDLTATPSSPSTVPRPRTWTMPGHPQAGQRLGAAGGHRRPDCLRGRRQRAGQGSCPARLHRLHAGPQRADDPAHPLRRALLPEEGEERNTLCARLLIAEDGLLLEETEFFAARISSHARLTYDDVSDWAEHGKQLDIDAGVLAQLPLMKAMTEARIAWRTEHALVFPDRPDYDFELGENGEVLAIHVEPRRIANRMVEESMIAANICATRAGQASRLRHLQRPHRL